MDKAGYSLFGADRSFAARTGPGRGAGGETEGGGVVGPGVGAVVVPGADDGVSVRPQAESASAARITAALSVMSGLMSGR